VRAPAIEVHGLSKKFCKSLRRALYYGAVDVVRSFVASGATGARLRRDEFWALDGLSFEVAPGETLGVIGENGSGKSTLLKLLNGILLPDVGRATVRGRMGALIEVGAGFHPMLTGRENIYVNGAILGMSRAEIDAKYESIVEFADVGTFLDVPIRNYSSGMVVRLGFAVAIHAEVNVLLVDEVLAVGDALFQYKCFERVRELRERGVTIVLVSHAMSLIERMCQRTLVLDRGRPVFLGDTALAIEKYFDLVSADARTDHRPRELDVREVRFSGIQVRPETGLLDGPIHFGQDLAITFGYETQKYAGEELEFRIGIKTMGGIVVSMMRFRRRAMAAEKLTLRIREPRLWPSTYIINVSACPVGMDIHVGGWNNALTFQVVSEQPGDYRFEYGQEYIVLFDYTVETET
jgi:ABC-type polysaccharide/polyol phosphate transport system ATPase subunit